MSASGMKPATGNRSTPDTLPAIVDTEKSKLASEDLQRLPQLLQVQLDRHEATVVDLLKESDRLAAERATDSLCQMEEMLEMHRSLVMDHAEAVVVKIQRATGHLDEVLDKLMQQRHPLGFGRAFSPPRAGGGRAGGGGAPHAGLAAHSSEDSRTSPYASEGAGGLDGLFDSLVAKINAGSEERLQAAQQQQMAEIERILQTHSQAPRYGNGAVALGVTQREGGDVTVASTNLDDFTIGSQVLGDGLVLSDPAEVKVEGIGGPNRRRSMQSEASARIGEEKGVRRFFSMHGVATRKMHHFPSYQATLDVVAAVMILLNSVWMGVEADIGYNAAKRDEQTPDWAHWVEIGFACFFVTEILARCYLQGQHFFRCPNVRLNLFDVAVVSFHVMDVTFSFYNFSWMRSIRVLRLFNAARIIRSVENIRHLRILVHALSGSLWSLFWVLTLLVFVLYLCSVFVMQTIRAHVRTVAAQQATVDPGLNKYYGSVGECMVTLFMAITGGAPWETLMRPLGDISVLFTAFYILYVVFVLLGLMNIVTAIFVESTKALAQHDMQMQVRDILRSKDSDVAQMRALLHEMDKDGQGTIDATELAQSLGDKAFAKRLKGIGMEIWEARGLFQLLDTDALGQVSIEEFLHGIVRLKCKDQSVDLTTVMYENKRILTRLLAFMRFAEDHFRDMETYLGMHSPGGKRAEALDNYLRDAHNASAQRFDNAQKTISESHKLKKSISWGR